MYKKVGLLVVLLSVLVLMFWPMPMGRAGHLFFVYKPVFVDEDSAHVSPGLLVFDIDGDGVELYKRGAYGSYFDFDSNGFANLTGWVEPDDCLLALDRNGNGVIDHISELFSYEGEGGVSKLSSLDGAGGLFGGDGLIDGRDRHFTDLVFWRDRNSDGKGQKKELAKIIDLGVVSISTQNTLIEQKAIVEEVKPKVPDNIIRSAGHYSLSGGKDMVINEVRFQYDPKHTRYRDHYDLYIRAIFRPDLKGYGDLADLHISMSKDNDLDDPHSLMYLMGDLSSNLSSLESLFLDWKTHESRVEAILFRWAGVEGVSPKSRGPHIDARRLAFNEAFKGDAFRQVGYFKKNFDIDYIGFKNPLPYAAYYSNAVYEYLRLFCMVRLTMQVLGSELFDDIYYNYRRDKMEGSRNLEYKAVERVEAIAAGSDNPDEVWMRLVQIMAYTKGLDYMSDDEIGTINWAIERTGKDIRNWEEAISKTEEVYGKIISSSEDWNVFAKD